ncbi:unnamed protein product [Ceutorhynchus assimilis]|uniref:Neurite outgrowth-associated protein n=1 Tax=Ceutorhynchus assimilis TaxID=467358 RepID=A0A9P0GRQ7_9CUCU|nr:unnamed protein product [Ceutorhynchus assimilis]
MLIRQSSSLVHLRRSKKDPGIYHQKKILQEDLENQDFEETESDFMNVHKSHKDHLIEVDAWKEKEKYLVVRQKYFKEKYPNFLTWHDKEQIRHLYNTNSEEWSVEKLSEGFPALPDVIQRIIKAKWTKKNSNNVYRHDLSVTKNWNEFKQGKLNNLPQELKQHLQKFSIRNLNFQQLSINTNNELVAVQWKPQIKGEFSEILSSYQKPKEHKTESIEEPSKFKIRESKEQLVTFKELQNKVKQKMSKGEQVTIQEELLKEAKMSINQPIELQQEDVNIIKPKTNEVGFVRKTTKDVSHLVYPQQITIPRDIYKKGYTYKLNDCYYDSDGEFLYRVPGMS